MTKTKTKTPNDARSTVKNPQSAAYTADRANRIALGHENVPPPATPPTTNGGSSK